MSGENDWIEWNGGKCPLGYVPVEIRYRDGVIGTGDACEFDPACWEHDGSKFDIIAYRVVQP